jgi:hypothetical protein
MQSNLAPRGTAFALGFVILVYAIAHVLPVTKVFDETAFGWQASCSAAQIAAEGIWHGRPEWLWLFGWLPNPLLWLGVACLWIGRRRDTRRAGLAAGLAGCLACAGAALWFFSGDMDQLFSGYYVWTASMLLLALVGFWTAVGAQPMVSQKVEPSVH